MLAKSGGCWQPQPFEHLPTKTIQLLDNLVWSTAWEFRPDHGVCSNTRPFVVYLPANPSNLPRKASTGPGQAAIKPSQRSANQARPFRIQPTDSLRSQQCELLRRRDFMFSSDPAVGCGVWTVGLRNDYITGLTGKTITRKLHWIYNSKHHYWGLCWSVVFWKMQRKWNLNIVACWLL